MIKNRSGIVHPWLYKSAIEPVFSNTHSREPKHFGWTQPAVSWGWNSSSLVDNGNLPFWWHGTFGCEQPWEQMSVWSQAAVYKKAGRESAWRTLQVLGLFLSDYQCINLGRSSISLEECLCIKLLPNCPSASAKRGLHIEPLPLVQGLFWTWVSPILFVSVL